MTNNKRSRINRQIGCLQKSGFVSQGRWVQTLTLQDYHLLDKDLAPYPSIEEGHLY